VTDPAVLPWQAAQWARLAAARAAGRVPHALLIAGGSGLGKALFARRLARALLCTRPDPAGDACGRCDACRLSRAGTHPDLQMVLPEAAGKPIKIDQVRELAARSVLAAQSGGFRVVLIEPAEAMNRAAANALLKTLEEPASRAVLLLVSSHPDRLAPTIRSRCQVIRFGPPAAAVVRDWLAGQVDRGEIDALLAISGGAPLRALQAQEEGWLEAARELVGELDALKRRRANPLRTVENWSNRSLTLLFAALQRCLADLLRLAGAGAGTGAALFHPGLRDELQCLVEGLDLRSLFRFDDELRRLERETTRNLNVQMQLEHLVYHWLETTRPGGH
jgi:DNA polymerase-3 subunit delta'